MAKTKGVTLMVGHTFVYNSRVKFMKELMQQEAFGDIYYMHAKRTNLGPIRNDTSALWVSHLSYQHLHFYRSIQNLTQNQIETFYYITSQHIKGPRAARHLNLSHFTGWPPSHARLGNGSEDFMQEKK